VRFVIIIEQRQSNCRGMGSSGCGSVMISHQIRAVPLVSAEVTRCDGMMLNQ